MQSTYKTLPSIFYQEREPTPCKDPTLIALNAQLLKELNLSQYLNNEDLCAIFSGNKIMSGTTPIAMAYAGHQFGHFVPQLGDGRALLLCEVYNQKQNLMDVQLKGCGQTMFSRAGDGKAPLSAVIREYILSEAMHALGIPSTRALAAVQYDEYFRREKKYPAGILTRVAHSHLRVGTFEFIAHRQDIHAMNSLAAYTLQRLFPNLTHDNNIALLLFKSVCHKHAYLIPEWLRVGFIHGVMNTDNCSLSGETIDYGPCAFLDEYHPDKVFSSIDYYGRYAFMNQLNVIIWNMTQFANALLLLDSSQAQIDAFKQCLTSFETTLTANWQRTQAEKIGFNLTNDSINRLTHDLFTLMQNHHLDYTITFTSLGRYLNNKNKDILSKSLHSWADKWINMLKSNKQPQRSALELMQQKNPYIIPRNHQVEAAIQAGIEGDISVMNNLLMALKTPYGDSSIQSDYEKGPLPDQRVKETFCGT